MPAGLSQRLIHPAVARFVGGEFLLPEGAIAGWRVAMFGATVPETTVNEDSDAGRVEHKVRLSEHRLPAPPTSDPVDAKEFHQGDLRILVAVSTNPGHDLGAFGLGENVGHGSTQRVSFFKQLRHETELARIGRPDDHCSVKSLIDCFTGCFWQQNASMTGGKIRELRSLPA